jgi:hypothetical protein
MYDPGTLPHFSVRSLLSSEIIWDTFATESLANPVNLFVSMTFPGAVDHTVETITKKFGRDAIKRGILKDQ